MFDMAVRALSKAVPSLSSCRLIFSLSLKTIEDRILILELAVMLALSNAWVYRARGSARLR